VTVFNAAVELVDVEIIKKVTLSGKISNANDNYRIMLWQNGIERTFISQCFITEDKTFCLENIVPGIYTIDIRKDGSIYYLNEIELNSNINLEVTLCLSGHGERILRGAIGETCGADGYSGNMCCVACGGITSWGEVIPATGEHDAEWVLDTPAQLGVPGREVLLCEICGVIDEKVIPAISADFAEDVGDLRDVVLTEDEKQQVEAGSVLQVELKSEDISETVSQTEKDLIAEKVSAENIGIYLDIDLIKYIGNSDPIPVTETLAPIKVTVAVPEAMLDDGVTYQIARIHGGVVDIIDGTYDPETKTFTFETDKFSTYVLIVKEESAGILGDVNGDTIVNSDDAVAILRYLAGYDSEDYDIDNGDYNKDGVTNSDDAVAILRMLAGYVD